MVRSMWCSNCGKKAYGEYCDICGQETEPLAPSDVYWCPECKVPVVRFADESDLESCPLCGGNLSHMTTDIRPVFPEERLLFEILIGKPLAYKNESVWCSVNRYYVNGKSIPITKDFYKRVEADEVRRQLELYKEQNTDTAFEHYAELFVKANQRRLDILIDEASNFIRDEVEKFPNDNIVISFSGGKDSTVVADLTIKALAKPDLVHIFSDTTLEFPITMEYAKRYRKDNPKAIFKIAKNKEENFYELCKEIGPPARMLRFCCSTFKTGPLTRVLNTLFENKKILTFYGIRHSESLARSKYDRVADNAESVKIQNQTVASPIIDWIDADVWLYLLGEKVDFNDAYRFGYDRVGCWCCPNNSARSQFLASVYMPEQYKEWRSFLIDFAKQIGKPDPEVYVDDGWWKARQGGNGVEASDDILIKFKQDEEDKNIRVYRLKKEFNDEFIGMLCPLGVISDDYSKPDRSEIVLLDVETREPIISVKAVEDEEYPYAVQIKLLNCKKKLEREAYYRMFGYQVRKYNACRRCLKCESLCKDGAISIKNGVYRINPNKCTHCQMCVTEKYLTGGCMMYKYLCIRKTEK